MLWCAFLFFHLGQINATGYHFQICVVEAREISCSPIISFLISLCDVKNQIPWDYVKMFTWFCLSEYEKAVLNSSFRYVLVF